MNTESRQPSEDVISANEPIAIIGMGCRYPKAEGITELWQLLLDGRDAIEPYDDQRFQHLDETYKSAAEGSGVVATHLGGFLPGIDRFDAAFFGISPREAGFIDPQHRLLLQAAWHALEDAGQVRQAYEGSRTGVFIGLWTTDYETHIYRTTEHPEFYLLTGGGRSTAPGRLSFSFGFEGPSVSVDTACSSSMVAIHLACQSLRLRECDMALGGGANVILSADVTRLFTNAGMLSPDGHCKFGDKSANGFVRSEGAGIVVLKRLSDAVTAGDDIYAVIRGSSVNNDGRSSGLLVTPSRIGQQQMLLQAWSQAGITGADLSYVEAHGTGTHVGDPIEVGAIADALRNTGATARVALGSIKTNIGHTESAAGVAGIIKTALVLHHGVIPASLHHHQPNPDIDWENIHLQINRQTRDLPFVKESKPRIAGASSFGLTGTNSHMVMAEHRETRSFPDGSSGVDPALSCFLLPVTAYTAESLRTNVEKWIAFLDDPISSTRLAEICYRAGARRTHLSHRFAAVGSSVDELKAQLRLFLEGQVSTSPEAGLAKDGPSSVVFVSPGQGSQWDGMARELYRENPAFRQAFMKCDQAIATETGWSLIERLASKDATDFLAQIDFVQPALFAMSIALAAVWRSVGVIPAAFVGHSMGEIAAAHLAGSLTLADAVAVICRRSKLMRGLSGSGAMASIELPAPETKKWIEQFQGRISIAAENSPSTTVVSGESEAVDQLLEWLELKEFFCRRIKVDVASHSKLVDPILPALQEQLANLAPQKETLPFFSTVDGALLAGPSLDAAYWVRNLREPVRLAPAIAALAHDGYRYFIELSPHPILVPALNQTLAASQSKAAASKQTASSSSGPSPSALPSLVRGNAAWPTLLRSMGRYWVEGGQLDWAALSGFDRSKSRITSKDRLHLPDYSFQMERFWPEESPSRAVRATGIRLTPLLRGVTELASEPGTTIFDVIVDLPSLPYLTDHRVGGAIVYPAAAHLEAALEAARWLAPESAPILKEVSFSQALYLSELESPEVQLVLRKLPGSPEVQTFSMMGRATRGSGEWTQHSSGTIVRASDEARPSTLPTLFDNNEAGGRQSSDAHYREALRSGLQYGPTFQLVESIAKSETSGTLAAQTRIRNGSDKDHAAYLLHPAVLDCCFQTMMHVRPRLHGMRTDAVYLPLAIGQLTFVQSSLPFLRRDECLLATAVFVQADVKAKTVHVDLELTTESGQLIARVDRMIVQCVQSQDSQSFVEDLFEFTWEPIATPPEPSLVMSAQQHWLILADSPNSDVSSSVAAALAERRASLAGRSTVVWQGIHFKALQGSEKRLSLLGVDEFELPANNEIALDQLLAQVTAEVGRISDVLNLWTLSDDPAQPMTLDYIMAAQQSGSKFIPALGRSILRVVGESVPRLWLLTRGTQSIPSAPSTILLSGAPVWGLGAVFMLEHPELNTALVDLGAFANPAEMESLVRVLLVTSNDSQSSYARENRIALRGERLYAARLVPCPTSLDISVPRELQAGEAYRIAIDHPGLLDRLHFRTVLDQPLAPDEVTIEVAYAGLNFIDVTKVMGVYPGLDPNDPIHLGLECSGRVVAVGSEISCLSPGDEVVALTPSHITTSMLASRVTVPAGLVAKTSAGMTLAESAALPIAYLTAHYSLNELGRLRKGEWVLIHAGAGGVGLAAAKIALAQGAHVIATASSAEKHAFLRQWGVEHVLQSRTLEFAEQVMQITAGRGVDIVLNSLAGDFIPKSIGVLAPYGRFIELGKRDIYDDRPLGLKAFRNNISYFAVDLAAYIEQRPADAAAAFQEVMRRTSSGEWASLPATIFSAADPTEPFRYMAQGKHTGKLVVDFTESTDSAQEKISTPRQVVSDSLHDGLEPLFQPNATYLLTGGLGGVGSAVAQWMIQNGATQLVLVSRRKAGPAEDEFLHKLNSLGATVVLRSTDLADLAAVETLISEIEKSMPPLRGILHAAAVIDNALLTDLTADRFDAVFGPKIAGAWHLHQATLHLKLDYFNLFSSVASIIPQPGHGSYSAANSFLDAFAGYRRSLGLAASAINWAGWLGLGLANEAGTQRSIAGYDASGMGSFERNHALFLLGEGLQADPAQQVAMHFDADRYRSAHDTVSPLLMLLVAGDRDHESTGNNSNDTQYPALHELAAASTQTELLSILESLLRTETSRVLKLAPERIGASQPFGQLGIDSLMALEFIRRVNGALKLTLPATAVFNYPTLTQLSIHIASRLGLGHESATLDREQTASSGSAVLSKASADALLYPDQQLSEDEALQALMEPEDSTLGY